MPDAPTLQVLVDKVDLLLERSTAPTVVPRFLTVDGAVIHASLSAASIRRLLASGRLTALRPCRGRVLIDRVELDSLILSSNGSPRHGRGLKHDEA
jgi:hypothetical protein